jgi:hypothetical protein
MKPFELSEGQFQKLMPLCRLYRREAEKCRDTKSYLAACVMIGAALEADLIAMCHCYADEIPAVLIPQGKNSQPKPLLQWSFAQLLQVARACDWLPARLALHDAWDHQKAHIGDYAVVVKDMRNLVHASRYLTDFARSRMTKRRMEMCFEILEVASDHLQAKLHTSLKAAMEKVEQEAADTSHEEIGGGLE